MNSDLEALIKAFEAYFKATDEDAKRLSGEYRALLQEVSERVQIPIELLDHKVTERYKLWRRAQEKRPPTSLHPRDEKASPGSYLALGAIKTGGHKFQKPLRLTLCVLKCGCCCAALDFVRVHYVPMTVTYNHTH
jgi:hypothetical protein